MDVRIQVILGVWNIAAEAGTHFWCIKACMPKKSCCWEQTRVRNSQLNPYVMWSTYVYPYTYFEKQNIYIYIYTLQINMEECGCRSKTYHICCNNTCVLNFHHQVALLPAKTKSSKKSQKYSKPTHVPRRTSAIQTSDPTGWNLHPHPIPTS